MGTRERQRTRAILGEWQWGWVTGKLAGACSHAIAACLVKELTIYKISTHPLDQVNPLCGYFFAHDLVPPGRLSRPGPLENYSSLLPLNWSTSPSDCTGLTPRPNTSRASYSAYVACTQPQA